MGNQDGRAGNWCGNKEKHGENHRTVVEMMNKKRGEG